MASTLFSLESLWEGQVPYCEDAQAALWRDPGGKELRPLPDTM